MASGASLAAALDAEGDHVPRAYRAIVAAGLKSGRLPEALETVAGLAESMQAFRRNLQLAAFYPLFVVALAYALFVVFIVKGVPAFSEMSYTMRLPASRLLAFFEWLRSGVGIWGWLVPLVGVLMVSGFAVNGWRRSHGWLDVAGGCLGWLPGAGGVFAELRRGWFCQLLAGLLEHGVPLPEGLELAAEAVGDAPLRSLQRAGWPRRSVAGSRCVRNYRPSGRSRRSCSG